MQHRQSVWMQILGLVEAGNLYFGYNNLLCYIQAWTGQLTLQVARPPWQLGGLPAFSMFGTICSRPLSVVWISSWALRHVHVYRF